MAKLQVAVIGFGELGSACANALIKDEHMTLAGVVRRADSIAPLPGKLRAYPVVGHVRDLPAVHAALVCVPPGSVFGVARELLQAHIPVVECAAFEGEELDDYHAQLDHVAKNYRAVAIVGAGWNPGIFSLLTKAFETLIPHGQHSLHRHPGVSLHHCAAVAHINGIKGALAGELRADDGALQRYVYVELEKMADFDRVRGEITADPLFAEEETQVFQVEKLSELEAEEGQGIVLERRGIAPSARHESLLLEARFDQAAFAAQVMLDGVRKIPSLHHGAHRYTIDY